MDYGPSANAVSLGIQIFGGSIRITLYVIPKLGGSFF